MEWSEQPGDGATPKRARTVLPGRVRTTPRETANLLRRAVMDGTAGQKTAGPHRQADWLRALATQAA